MNDTMETIITPRKIPVMATVERAYELLWVNRLLIFKNTWIPLLLFTVAIALQTKFIGTAETPDQIKDKLLTIPSAGIISWLASLTLATATLLAFNLSWRRHLLLKEPPSSLYFAKPLWRYVGFSLSLYVGLCLFLIVVTLAAAAFFAALGLKTQPALFQLSLILMIAVALGLFIFLLIRHILLFTAITVENNLSWKMARQVMQGNTLRYIAIWLMVIVPLSVAGNVLLIMLMGFGLTPDGIVAPLLIGLLQAALTLMQITLGSSTAALIYDFLIRGGGPKELT